MKNVLTFLILFLSCSIAQGMEGDDEQQIEASSPTSYQAALKLIAQGVNKLARTAGKYVNPYEYATSEESKNILLLAAHKFNNAQNEREINSLLEYKAQDTEPIHITGNLLKKVYDRKRALDNVIEKQTIKVVINSSTDQIRQNSEKTILEGLYQFRANYVNPAYDAIDTMLFRIYGIKCGIISEQVLELKNGILEESEQK